MDSINYISPFVIGSWIKWPIKKCRLSDIPSDKASYSEKETAQKTHYHQTEEESVQGTSSYFLF